ncbi:MAG: hypothetical protein D6730_17055 [Bacteroidetes bacterium]|nr:MAG: hypothetical protein D6730_17055 [Bacteroidota bacterium]
MKFALSLIIAGLLWTCSSPASEEQQAPPDAAYLNFIQQFDSLSFRATDTLDCDSLMYGALSEKAGKPTRIRLAMTEMRALIPPQLWKKARLDTTEQYYALGRFPFASGKEACMIGAYMDEQRYSTHLFIYDLSQHAFTHTQSLNFTMGGGPYLNHRKAWLCDLNQDGILDVVYKVEESLNLESEEDSFFKSSLHAEIWDGYRFVEYPQFAATSVYWDSLQLASDGY